MSESTSLHTYVNARFREAFGPPNHSMGKDDHWRIEGSSTALAINILLNGTRDTPALWVFDPHDPNEEVYRSSISQEGQVDAIIKQIQERVKRAAQPLGSRND